MNFRYLAIPFLFLLSNLAYGATVYNEVGDAGDSLATAQTTTNTMQTFDQIQGTLSPTAGDAVDMYKIFITGGGDFSAKTIGGVAFDSELYLFDSTGKGVYANDDTNGFLTPSVLPANNPLTPTVAGYYYLAISQCCDQPLSADGPIFQDVDGNQITHELLSGPTGVGGASPLTSFSGGFDQGPGGGAYTIFLTGASLASGGAVPEPSTWAMMLAGFAGLGYAGYRVRRNSAAVA